MNEAGHGTAGAVAWREVGIGIVVDPASRILICQRLAEAPLGGLWEFPGGKIEPGETPATCVEREVREETGLVVRAGQALASIEHAYPETRVRLRPYVCAVVSGTAQAIQCQAVRWVTRQELSDYPFPAANGDLIRSLGTGNSPAAGDDHLGRLEDRANHRDPGDK